MDLVIVKYQIKTEILLDKAVEVEAHGNQESLSSLLTACKVAL